MRGLAALLQVLMLQAWRAESARATYADGPGSTRLTLGGAESFGAALADKSGVVAHRLDLRLGRPKPQGSLAVIVVGVLERMVFPNFLKSVVAPAVLSGYKVDVFMRLVEKGNNGAVFGHLSGFRFAGEPAFAGLAGRNLTDYISKRIASEGGRAVLVELVDGHEAERIEPVPKGMCSRMRQYSPCDEEIGRNVLKRYMTLSALIDQVLRKKSARGGFAYDWVLELREDISWLAPLDLRKFQPGAGAPVLYSVGCLNWGGINDHALLYTPEAGAHLRHRYGDYYNNTLAELDTAYNAETYLYRFAIVHKVTVHFFPFTEFAAYSSQYDASDGQLRVCAREHIKECFQDKVLPNVPEDCH